MTALGDFMASVIRQMRAFALTWVVVASGLLAGCASNQSAPWADLGSNPPTSMSLPLAVGDKIKVTVFEEPNLSDTFEVGADGFIGFPLIGRVRALGRTPEGLRSELNRRLADGYLKNPRTTISIVNYQPIFVHGEVRRGGEFPFKSGLTFRDAIAVAGGYTYRAEESYVLLTRRGQTRPLKVRMPSTAFMQPGDNIRIPERFF
ncbi:MAG: polysaccharide biosynthesis/export family protein [Pseudomonadota bacterium]